MKDYMYSYQLVLDGLDTSTITDAATLEYLNRLNKNPNDKKAKEALYAANVLFATRKAFAINLLDKDDAFAAASEGLLNAINDVEVERIQQISERYNRGINASFITFATGYIKNSLNTALNDYSQIPTTEYERKNIRCVRAAYRDIIDTYGDTLSYSELIIEICKRTFLNENQVEIALQCSNTLTSLDMEIRVEGNLDSEIYLKDAIEDNKRISSYEQHWRECFMQDIHNAVNELPETLNDIVVKFTGFNGDIPVSAQKIAKEYNHSRMWVYNKLDEAYDMLKEREEDFYSYYYIA